MERAAAAAAGRNKGVASTANGVTGTGVERDEEGEDDYEDEMAEEEQVAIGGIASGRQQRKEHIEQDMRSMATNNSNLTATYIHGSLV